MPAHRPVCVRVSNRLGIKEFQPLATALGEARSVECYKNVVYERHMQQNCTILCRLNGAFWFVGVGTVRAMALGAEGEATVFIGGPCGRRT